MLDVFTDMVTCNLDQLQERMKENQNDKWKEDIPSKAKLRVYRTLKENYGVEEYVAMNLDRGDRSFLAQFRMGILPIRVETGRFKQEKLEERICVLCDSGSIEDETRFLLKCNRYNDQREYLLRNAMVSEDNWHVLSDSEKMTYLVNEKPRQTSKFIREAFLHRRNILYK